MADNRNLRATLNHMGRVASQQDWHMSRHVHHEFHELIVVVTGALEVRIRGQRVIGRPGDVLHYPQGVWHTEHSVGDEPLETLFLAWRWHEPWMTVSLPLRAIDGRGRVQSLIVWMFELFPTVRSMESHMIDVLLDALLFEVQHLTLSPDQQLVARVKAFVQNSIDRPLALGELAEEVGLSKYHFSRKFKAATGVTPMAFVRQLRVEAARSLLLSTSWTLRAVADQVGFADEFQLSRVFKRVTGVPPSHVRSTHLVGYDASGS
jgi:AraC-like DNA-binding protein